VQVIVLIMSGSKGVCSYDHLAANRTLSFSRYAEILAYHKQAEIGESVTKWAQATTIARTDQLT
jgi:hypothetical protein